MNNFRKLTEIFFHLLLWLTTALILILFILKITCTPSLKDYSSVSKQIIDLDTSSRSQSKEKKMNYFKTKSTKRFQYTINRNNTAKQAGSNVVTISTNPTEDGQYSIGQSSLTLTVREAKALNSFLSDNLNSVDMA